MKPLEIPALKAAVRDTVNTRRCSTEVFSYAQHQGESEALYGLTGAVNILDAIDLLPRDRMTRQHMGERILSYQDTDGCFDGSDGAGHALHMVIGALNLLGQPIPRNAGPLAPRNITALPGWLDRLDWNSTHKELCGSSIPLLASGLVSDEWVDLFRQSIDERIDTWRSVKGPRWRVISCIFHILSCFDAGRLPYPHPQALLGTLRDLSWENVPEAEERTYCTDGDWALLLLQLCRQLPNSAERSMQAIRQVSARRIEQWHKQRESILRASTHHLYCYLWSTAVFQSCVRDHYVGGYLRDTFNDPSLFRLQR